MRKLHWNVSLLLALALCACAHQTPKLLDERILEVEAGLIESYGAPPWRRMRLEDRMAESGVPGLSIVVIDNFEIDWAKAYGVMDVSTGEPVSCAGRSEALQPPSALKRSAPIKPRGDCGLRR